MNKNISNSDEVYRKLKREKGDRSFNELIEERLDAGGKLADVTGQRIFEPGVYEAIKVDIDRGDDVRTLDWSEY